MKIWVNADDFGFSKSCSDAIFECFQKGIITTTTVCANGEYFDYAIKLIKGTPYEKRIGLHLNITEGKPLTNDIKSNKKICDKDGNFILFPKPYSRLTKEEKQNIYNEMQAQIDALRSKGIEINHLDSHHHIHNSFRILPIVIKLAENNGINYIRLLRNAGNIKFYKRIYKNVLNKKLKKYAYTSFMGDLNDIKVFDNKRDIVFELMIHPDYDIKQNLIDRINDDYSKPEGKKIAFDMSEVIK